MALVIRQSQIFIGSPFDIFTRYGSLLVQSFIFGSVFYNLPLNAIGGFTRGSALFCSVLFNCFVSIQPHLTIWHHLSCDIRHDDDNSCDSLDDHWRDGCNLLWKTHPRETPFLCILSSISCSSCSSRTRFPDPVRSSCHMVSHCLLHVWIGSSSWKVLCVPIWNLLNCSNSITDV